MGRKRAIVAGLFAVVYPGLGHVYLREWLRAIAWFGTALLVAVLVIPESAVQAFETGGVVALFQTTGDLPLEAAVALFVVRILNIADAIWLGLDSGTPDQDGEACPHCGGDLDADLEFCPWCTTYLGPKTDARGEGSVPGDR